MRRAVAIASIATAAVSIAAIAAITIIATSAITSIVIAAIAIAVIAIATAFERCNLIVSLSNLGVQVEAVPNPSCVEEGHVYRGEERALVRGGVNRGKGVGV